jgi:hypothetical protein
MLTVSASRVVFVARHFSKMLGTPKGRGIRGCFSLVTFFLQKQKKVTSCRATPGSVAKSSLNKPHTAQIATLSAPYDSRHVKEQTPAFASTSKQKCLKTPANIRPSLFKNLK